jgi:hypothetical protein
MKKFVHESIDTCLADKTLFNFNKTKIWFNYPCIYMVY